MKQKFATIPVGSHISHQGVVVGQQGGDVTIDTGMGLVTGKPVTARKHASATAARAVDEGARDQLMPAYA